MANCGGQLGGCRLTPSRRWDYKIWMVRTLLKAMLVFTGITTLSVYPLAVYWPSGWAWHPGRPADSEYFMMIVGVYATLGVFLLRAASNPAAHRSLIWFTVWSSLVHGAIMAAQSVAKPEHGGHLLGDVPALLLAAVALGALNWAEARQPPPDSAAKRSIS
jgi:hypothetical protein